MKNLKYAAIAALPFLAACSSDEVVNMQQDGIAYQVTANNITRAADSYCNNVKPESFKVWAMTVGNPSQNYINGDLIVKNGNEYTDQAGTRYWPENTALDFYAEVNGDDQFELNGGAPYFKDFKVESAVTAQRDLMYAVAKNVTRSSSQNRVALNFRHALSQVCFKARNDAQNLKVVVKGVSAGHLSDQGSFTFPATSTSQNYEHPSHGDVDDPNAPSLNGGTWTNLDAADNRYDVTGLAVTLDPHSAAANLTAPEDNHANGFANVMTLLPQKQDAWKPEVKGAEYNGAYFMLDVEIYNVASGVETIVHNGKCVIPVNIDWKQGFRYIYTLIFDEGGNGGYTDNPSDPRPVLANVDYEVEIDDFIPTDDDEHMNGDGKDPVVQPNEWTLTLMNGTEKVQEVKVSNKADEFDYSLAGLPTLPDTETMQFAGWSTTQGGEAQSMIHLVKGTNPTLYAVYKEFEEVTYHLIFDANADPDVTVYFFPVKELTYGPTKERSHTFELPQGLKDGKDWMHPSIGGNNFNAGWKFDKNGDKADIVLDGFEYKPGTLTLTADKPEVTLYVHWTTGTPAGGEGTIGGSK